MAFTPVGTTRTLQASTSAAYVTVTGPPATSDGAQLMGLVVTNQSSTDADNFEMYIVPSGASRSDDHLVIPSTSIYGDDYETFNLAGYLLDGSGYSFVFRRPTQEVNIHISYYQQD